jgi:hypothetical protein
MLGWSGWRLTEGNFDLDVMKVVQLVREYIFRTGRRPVVFVDYLQVLKPIPVLIFAIKEIREYNWLEGVKQCWIERVKE